MEIVVEKAVQSEVLDGRTCNCGSNPSGSQGSMCRSADQPLVTAGESPNPPLSD